MLTDYIYINENLVQNYYEQVKFKPNKDRKFSWKFSLSLTGPAIETGQEISNRSPTTHEKVQQIIEFFKHDKLLGNSRPSQHSEYDNGQPFVLETFTAQKVIVPQEYWSKIKSLKGFAVWVSDPEIDNNQTSDISCRATYLYLLESHWDNEEPSSAWSNCSALQAMLNMMAGVPTEINEINSHVWGYLNKQHPIQKLMKSGAFISDNRRITSLYRKRLFSDEQSFVLNNRSYCVNDMIGYPIFIANAFNV